MERQRAPAKSGVSGKHLADSQLLRTGEVEVLGREVDGQPRGVADN